MSATFLSKAVFAALLAHSAAMAQWHGVVVANDGTRSEGRITMGEDQVVQVRRDEQERQFALADLAELRAAEAAPTRIDAPHRVWLRSGAELPALALALRADPARLEVDLPCGARIAFPLGTVRALRQAGATRPEPLTFAADLAAPLPNSDLLFVARAGQQQRSSVRVTGAAQDQVQFELRGRSFAFAFAEVAGLVFGANTGFAPDAQAKPRAQLSLVTGEQLQGRLLSISDRVRLRTDEGALLDVPVAAMLAVTIASDRLVYLGTLQPEVAQTPALDRIWPWTVDRTVVGQGLQLGGKTYARGIAMIPRTRLTYSLAGKYDQFAAVVGIDERAGDAGCARFRILADTRVLFDATLTRRSAPQTVTLALQRCATLVLEVDFASNFDLGDHCVFADARVSQL